MAEQRKGRSRQLAKLKHTIAMHQRDTEDTLLLYIIRCISVYCQYITLIDILFRRRIAIDKEGDADKLPM